MKRAHTQRGLALPTTLVLMSLVALGCMGTWRSLWVAEQRLNHETDQLRCQHRAEAVLPIAVADIMGPALSLDQASDTRHTATPNAAFFPNDKNELLTLQQHLVNACEQGICTPTVEDASAHKPSHWWALREQAATVDASKMPDGQNAWYWVEVFNAPAQNPPFIYRITVAVEGAIPAGQVVLQTLWTRTGTTRTGAWHSWAVLHD